MTDKSRLSPQTTNAAGQTIPSGEGRRHVLGNVGDSIAEIMAATFGDDSAEHLRSRQRGAFVDKETRSFADQVGEDEQPDRRSAQDAADGVAAAEGHSVWSPRGA